MAVRGVQIGGRVNDTRRATKEWDPWLIPCTKDDTSPHPKKCTFCGWSKAFVRKRALTHFGYGGSAALDRCPHIPRAVFLKFKNCGGIVPKFMNYEEIHVSIVNDSRLNVVEESVVEARVDVEVEGFSNPLNVNETPAPTPDSVDSTATTIHKRMNLPSVSCQRNMDEALQLGLRQKLDKMWALFFYEANIAFNVLRHPAFVNAVKETATAGLVYHPPSYNAMRTKMIDVKKVAVQSMVSEQTKQSISQYGATICSDGWSDTNTRPLLNVMLVCPAGDVFLASANSTGEKKDIQYTTDFMGKYIE